MEPIITSIPESALTAVTVDEPGASNPADLMFVYHPARRQPGGSLLVILVLVLIAVVSHAALGSDALTIFMMLLFVGHMVSFIFPSEYRINHYGIALRRLGVRHVWPWSRFRYYAVHPGGVYLSSVGPYARLVSAVRGVYLIMDKAQLKQLQPYLEAHVHAR